MNLVLLRDEQEAHSLPGDDPRVAHIRTILRMGVGDRFYVGLPNGPRGLATITGDNGAGGLTLHTVWEREVQPPQPLTLVIGLPRPQTARKVLHDVASMGIRAVHFFQAEKGEPSYAGSSLWKADEWRHRLEEGAAQGFTTTLPVVSHAASLRACIEKLDTPGPCLALDIYEAGGPLAAALAGSSPDGGDSMLAIGPERGWSAAERDVLRERFTLVHLGERVLRTEVAVVAGAALVLAARGALDKAYVNELADG